VPDATESRQRSQSNELANPGGCLITDTATEFVYSDPRIAAGVANGLTGYRDMFREASMMGQSATIVPQTCLQIILSLT